MLLHRLLIEFQPDQRWVALRKELADAQPSEFRLDDEFDTSDVAAAACATGWVVQRDGECWISADADCDALADIVNEMLFYFLRSGEPRSELVRLREHIKPYWNEKSNAPLCLWASAFLDLAVRERIADAARHAEDLWHQPALQLRVDTHLRTCIDELASRYANISKAVHDITGFGKMTPSQRKRSQQLSEKEVG